MYDCTILNEATWRPYAPLADKSTAMLLKLPAAGDQALVLGASFWGRPAGLVAAELDCAPGYAVVRDFAIGPLYQESPVGAMLLQQLETILRARGFAALEFSYHVDEQSAAYERALAAAGWTPPKHVQNYYVTHRERECLSWLRGHRLPAGFTIFPWSEITAAETAQIKRRQGDGGWFPWETSPFVLRTREQLDLECSIGLRHAGQVVGWMIVERLEPTFVYLTVAFISPELRQSRLGLAMSADLSRRMWAAGVRTMALEARPGSSVDRFAERVWAPFLVYRTERRATAKQLVEP